MIIGIPRETERLEHRVGLTPFALSRLVSLGHSALVERDAGSGAHFADQDFTAIGAEIAYSSEEIYQRSDVICQVGILSPAQLELLRPGSLLCGFHHLAVAARATLARLARLETTVIGYEIIENESGDRPALLAMSELAGQLATHVAAHLLQIQSGGRGVLLGNVPGVPSATVLILGAGSVGTEAARHAAAIGAHVIVMDEDVRKLQRLHHALGGSIDTALLDPPQLARLVAVSDVVIGAVLVPGGRAPFLVTEAMVRSMRPGSVIIDVSIDQGGCVETSRPTTLDHPTFRVHDVVHYCVPNMTANVARTASRTMADAVLPYILEIVSKGIEAAFRADPGLACGVYLYRGRVIHDALAKVLGTAATPLASLVSGSGAR